MTTATDYYLELLEDAEDQQEFWAEVQLIAGTEWQFGTEPPEWLVEAAHDCLMETFQEDYWLNIPQAIRNDIQAKLRAGVEQGHSIRDIATEIMENDGYSRQRATNVARTEMNEAMNRGHEAGIQQIEEETGIEIGKEWGSVFGPTSRETHKAMDGKQTVTATGLFDFESDDGEVYEVRVPGDRVLPARERCNCQCFVLSAIVMSELDEEKAVKHLPGQHDQTTHGRGGSRLVEAGEAGESAVNAQEAPGTTVVDLDPIDPAVKALDLRGLSRTITMPGAYSTILGPVKRALDLEGDGHERFHVIEKGALTAGARAESRDNHSITLGDELAAGYDAAMAKPISEWTEEDARNVSAVFHEVIHGLGARGYHTESYGAEFIEEGATETLARAMTCKTMIEGGASKEVIRKVQRVGAYNPDVEMFGEIARQAGMTPESLAKKIKMTDDRSRFKVIAEALGGVQNNHTTDVAIGAMTMIQSVAQLNRMVGGYDEIQPYVKKMLDVHVTAFRKLAQIPEAHAKEMVEAISDAGEGHIYFSDTYDAMKKTREVLKQARSDLRGSLKEPVTDWEKTRVAKLQRIVKLWSPIFRDKDIKEAFYIKR
jgi:hypothetical protein